MTAGQEVKKIETRLRQLGGKLDHLAGLGAEMADDAHLEYRKQIDHTKGKFAVVQDKLQRFRNSGGQKWENFKASVALAWEDFERAFKAIKQGPLVPIPVESEIVRESGD
jgi:hypothetical protein